MTYYTDEQGNRRFYDRRCKISVEPDTGDTWFVWDSKNLRQYDRYSTLRHANAAAKIIAKNSALKSP